VVVRSGGVGRWVVVGAFVVVVVGGASVVVVVGSASRAGTLTISPVGFGFGRGA